MASTAYSEHVGWNRHAPENPLAECRSGETHRRYRSATWGIALFFVSLYHGKNIGHFSQQSVELRSQHGSPGVEDDIDIARQQGQIDAHGFTPAPLEAVPLDSLAQDAAGGQPHPRSRRRSENRTCDPLGKKVGHGRREVFPATLVHTLIVGMLAQPSVALGKKRQQNSLGRKGS